MKRLRKTMMISPEHDRMIAEMAYAQRRTRVAILELAVEQMYQHWKQGEQS